MTDLEQAARALLPCPFCGNTEPLLQEHPAHPHFLVGMPDHHGSWTIECAACNVGIIEDEPRAKDHVIARWNRRAALDAAAGRVSVPSEPTEAMVDAPRQIILYAETQGRTLEGLRAHLVACGVDYLSWAPVWATRECGHLTKGAIAILVYRAMLAAAQEES